MRRSARLHRLHSRLRFGSRLEVNSFINSPSRALRPLVNDRAFVRRGVEDHIVMGRCRSLREGCRGCACESA